MAEFGGVGQGLVRFGWVWWVWQNLAGFGKVWVGLAGSDRVWRGLTRFGGVWDHMIVDGFVPMVRVPGRCWELLVAMEVFKSICLGTI